MGTIIEDDAVNLFNRWLVEPIERLKAIPNGDGAFVAFMVALPLYERLTVARLKLANQPTGEDEIRAAMSGDIGLDPRERSIFWEMFRNGLLHHAMPKAGKTSWLFEDSFSAIPQFKTFGGNPVVCINPWKSADRVFREFLADPQLIVASESFPMGSIFGMHPHELS
jgi:hypothetical protein